MKSVVQTIIIVMNPRTLAGRLTGGPLGTVTQLLK